MQFNREKLRALVLYVCSKCPPSQLGAVKLHKVLYFSDMIHFVASGTPITGAPYRKRPFGPTCDPLLPLLRDMENSGELEVDKVDYFGFWKKEYHSRVEPDLSRFSDAEIHLIDDIIDFVCLSSTARQISEFSHNRAWELAEPGEELPYSSAFVLIPHQASPETLEWAEEEASKIASAESKGESMETRDFRAFRSRILAASGPH